MSLNLDFSRWREFQLLSTFIVGHRYITVFHNKQNPRDVIDAVKEFANELDDEAGLPEYHEKPFVILSQQFCTYSQFEESGLEEFTDIIMR